MGCVGSTKSNKIFEESRIPDVSSGALISGPGADSYAEFRLSYISRATREIPSKEIEEIIAISQRNNARKGVTGALVSCGSIFLQTLEGERETVMQLYKHIEHDDRHTDCVIVNTETAPAPGLVRQYHGWDMQNINLAGNETVIQKALNTMLRTVCDSHYMLEAYTQKSVLDMIRDGVDPRTRDIETTEKVILFSDIVSYTTITESKPMDYIYKMLNEYYSIMDTHISDEHGEVSKLLGDGLMASFDKKDVVGALNASIAAVKDLKKKRKESEFDNLDAGIGLSFGEIIQGSFGSKRKKDFTYISDICNLSSRLEGLTRTTGHSILFDESVYSLVKDSFENIKYVGEHFVKGKKEKIQVYTIDDPELKIQTPELLSKKKEPESLASEAASISASC